LFERILITGGNGFIGSRLARRLIEEGRDVHLVLRPGSPVPRLHGLAKRYRPWEVDLADAAGLAGAVKRCKPNLIFNLACRGVLPGRDTRGDLLTTNVSGTANLLDALRPMSYDAFIQVGSGVEYGPSEMALTENIPLAPVTDYASSKAAAALLCLAEGRQGKPVSVVRIFSAYGPGEASARLVPYVMNTCARGERPRVSAGTQRRDMIFVDDVVDLLIAAADHPGHVLHAATGEDTRVRDLIEMITDLVGGPPAVFGDRVMRPGEPERYCGDFQRTTAATGWRPRVDLAEGLRRTWESLRPSVPALQPA